LKLLIIAVTALMISGTLATASETYLAASSVNTASEKDVLRATPAEKMATRVIEDENGGGVLKKATTANTGTATVTFAQETETYQATKITCGANANRQVMAYEDAGAVLKKAMKKATNQSTNARIEETDVPLAMQAAMQTTTGKKAVAMSYREDSVVRNANICTAESTAIEDADATTDAIHNNGRHRLEWIRRRNHDPTATAAVEVNNFKADDGLQWQRAAGKIQTSCSDRIRLKHNAVG
jgi:hypothetical protein